LRKLFICVAETGGDEQRERAVSGTPRRTRLTGTSI
jgi:hypothetical protein